MVGSHQAEKLEDDHITDEMASFEFNWDREWLLELEPLEQRHHDIKYMLHQPLLVVQNFLSV